MSDGVCPRCNRQGKEDYKEKTVEVKGCHNKNVSHI